MLCPRVFLLVSKFVNESFPFPDISSFKVVEKTKSTSVRVTSRQKLYTKVIYFSCIADLVCDWFSYPLKRNRFQHWHQMPKWKLIFRNILKNAWKYRWNDTVDEIWSVISLNFETSFLEFLWEVVFVAISGNNLYLKL